MTDATPPNDDFFEQLRRFSDEAIPEIIEHWRSTIKGRGRKSVRLNCSHCGNAVNGTVEVADNKELLDIANALRLARAEQSKQNTGGDTSKQAHAILGNIAEMTSEEIAEELARLDAA